MGSAARGARRQIGLALLLVLVGLMVLGPPGTATSWAFTDVPDSFWAAAWIAWLVDLGVVKGYAGDIYKPDDPVTRAQMAVYIGRAVQEARPARGLAWVTPAGGGEVDVNAVADFNAVPDPSQSDPGLAAGYRLYASTDGVNFTPAANATYNGLDFGVVTWTVTGVTASTYFKPVAIVSLGPPAQERPLCGVLMARPSEMPGTITVTEPPSMAAPRLPMISWSPVSGAALYLLAVAPNSPSDSDPIYVAALEGWRTSLLFGYRAGPGIIQGVPKVDALDATTQYSLMLIAVDGTGWTIAYTEQSFTTGS